MSDRSWTILILPHSKSRFRKIRLTERRIRIGLATVAVLVLATLALPFIGWVAVQNGVTLSSLRTDHNAVLEESATFGASLDEVDARLAEYESVSQQLGAALGIDELSGATMAAGGPFDGTEALPGGAPFADAFDGLRSRGDRLDSSFHQLSDAWMEREQKLASTPAIMPVRGWLSDGYGWRKDPFTSKRAFHRGVDIVAPRGTPVRASADGVVAKAGRLGAYGKRVDISHGFGFISRYAHMHELLVKPGQEIRRGDIIGRVGSTGRSTAPHLHYEIFRDGRRVNPWKYLADRDG